MKVSDYVIQFLESKKVEDIFTISGGGCMHLIDSLGKSNKIRYICNHHEQATAMAMEGYARLKGKPGVGIVTTGPGGTNTLTGVMGAWTDSIPCIFISGQVPTSQLKTGTGCRQVGDQEIDIVSMVKGITKFSCAVMDGKDIKYALEKAYFEATTGRCGPVWVDIPLDVQSQTIKPEELCGYSPSYVAPVPTASQVRNICTQLKQAKKPLIVVGRGVRSSEHGIDALNKFLNITGMPVVTGAHSGVDVVNTSYDNYCGRIGVLGHRSSNHIVQQCDFLIVVGSRLGLKMTGYDFRSFAESAKYKAMVDIDINEMRKPNILFDELVHSDAGVFFNELISNLKTYRPSDDVLSWRSHCAYLRSQEKFVLDHHKNVGEYCSNYCFVDEYSKIVDPAVPTITSNGSAHVVTLKGMSLTKKQRLFTNVGCASMGYGLPAAIGACVATKSKVVCIEGDGSLQMNIQELQTIKHYRLPVVLYVINNGGYLSIKLTQERYFNSKYVGTNANSGVSCPSLENISCAYGIKYLQIKSNSDIEKIVKQSLSCDGPVICEVFTDPTEKHEPRVVSIINEQGQFVPGKLTDME